MSKDIFDVIIAGAGPGGIAAALKAKEEGLNYLVLEKGKDIFSGIINFYPPGKKVYPTLPKGAPGWNGSILKPPEEKVIVEEYFQRVKDAIELVGGLNINTGEKFLNYCKEKDHLLVQTDTTSYRTKNLVIAIGSNIPRDLNVYGEARTVARTLHKPEEYLGRHVLVIGGGNAGADVVISLSKYKREEGDHTRVYWAHRKKHFKIDNNVAKDVMREIQAGGKIFILRGAEPIIGDVDKTGIRRLTIKIEDESFDTGEDEADEEIKIHKNISFPMKNVIACIGFCSPAQFCRQIGLELMERQNGKKSELLVFDENLQSIKGVYAIGGVVSPMYMKHTTETPKKYIIQTLYTMQ